MDTTTNLVIRKCWLIDPVSEREASIPSSRREKMGREHEHRKPRLLRTDGDWHGTEHTQ